ncbi:Mediator of RNA polymerase II transcription subunit 6 [Zancudomyces culisetae]|uniref:Mediator of RNA polymerase II transcription subunit 6 n=1 Tax=Zancudomyces culisetae TaxID=1213189 RepID=A0A1R1PCR7_ZANCU|nr:Mediator of RNA polymerase II transcription subunit 6 [Zancudomyces culisetae]|eukprot:OMH78766.1 Mediator of RNA polymerase II transcription subunit 6 [Zancudomyces culisetae]
MDDKNKTLETEDLMGIEWRFSEWIMQAGGLTPSNVMEYFSLSPFWDPTSNNALTSLNLIEEAFQLVSKNVKYHPYSGYSWGVAGSDSKPQKDASKEKPTQSASYLQVKNQFNSAIDYMLEMGPNKYAILAQQTRMAEESALKTNQSVPSVLSKSSNQSSTLSQLSNTGKSAHGTPTVSRTNSGIIYNASSDGGMLGTDFNYRGASAAPSPAPHFLPSASVSPSPSQSRMH